jgi:hypothetical protein
MKTTARTLKTTILAAVLFAVIPLFGIADELRRARDLGVPFEGTPGVNNAITDVEGVLVGHTTLISGDGDHDRRQSAYGIRIAGRPPAGHSQEIQQAGRIIKGIIEPC